MTRRDLIKALCQGALIVGVGETMRLVQPRRAIAAGAPRHTAWPKTILGDRYPEWRRDPAIPGFGLRGPFEVDNAFSMAGLNVDGDRVVGGEYTGLGLFEVVPNGPRLYTLQYVAYCPREWTDDKCFRGGGMYASASWPAEGGVNPVGEIDARLYAMEMTLIDFIERHREEEPW